VPRCTCDDHGVKRVEVPWARAGSGFTLLFEALVMALVREMPVMAVSRLIGEHGGRIWRILHHHVDEARAEVDRSGLLTDFKCSGRLGMVNKPFVASLIAVAARVVAGLPVDNAN
jgi:hypothetical protein